MAAQRAQADAIYERLIALSKWIREDRDARIPKILRALEGKP